MGAMPNININVPTDKINSNVFLSLLLAVIHHGLANLAERAVPARAEKVTETAMVFEDHLNEVPIGEARRRRDS